MIPAYNEEQSIGNVIHEIPRKIGGIDDVKVLVIDDGSTDRTVEVAEKAGADKIISHSENKGVGAAFQTGLDNALKMSGDIIVNIDADGQFDPKEIPKLIKPILENKADAVIGSRFLDKTLEPKMPTMKKIGNKVFTKIINKVTKNKFTDTQCGFRAFSRDAVLRIILFGEFTYTQEVLISIAKSNMTIKEIPINVSKRLHGKSKVVKTWYSYGKRALTIIIRSYCDIKPLKVFGAISFIVFLASVYFFVHVLKYYLNTGVFTGVVGSALLAGFLFTTAIIIFTFGILADIFKRQREMQEEILYRLKKK